MRGVCAGGVLGGIAGQLYKQFAVTVAVAVVLSGVVALTLTRPCGALLLKAQHSENKLFAPFNRAFDRLTNRYTGTVRFTLRHGLVGVLVFAGVVGATALLFKIDPRRLCAAGRGSGPADSALSLPDGATLKRTEATGERMRQMVAKDPAVEHTFIVSGFDLISGGNKTNASTVFVTLKDWSEREGKAQDMVGKFTGFGMSQPDGMALVFNPAPIQGLGTTGGFEVYVQNRVDGDPKKLSEVLNVLMDELKKHRNSPGFLLSSAPPCRSCL